MPQHVIRLELKDFQHVKHPYKYTAVLEGGLSNENADWWDPDWWASGSVANAHKELKDILNRALGESYVKGIPLEEIQIICPQLLNISAWGGYSGAPWDGNYNSDTLINWWKGKNSEIVFHINASGDKNLEEKKFTTNKWVLVTFAKRADDSRGCSFQA